MPFRIPVSRIASVPARRICIIKPSALGDVVQSLPLLPALRRGFPGASIHWVINREFAELLQGHPDLDQVIPFDRHGSWRAFVRLLGGLRRERFDLVFDLQGLLRSAVMTMATAAPVRVGLQTAREGSGCVCNCVVPGTGWDIPAHLRCESAIGALGQDGAAWNSGLFIPEAARNWATSRLTALRRPILAIHAGAGWETKRWPPEKFAAVAARFNGSIVTVGSVREAPLAEPIVTQVRGAGGAVLDLAGATSLPQLAAVLEAADALLSNDSGPLHLAAAAGTPVVGIYTCTSPILSGPVGAGHELISTGVECAAGYCKRCPHPGTARLSCFDDITVENVCRAVERAVAGGSIRRQSA